MRSPLIIIITITLAPQLCFSQSIFERTGNVPIFGIGYGRVMAGSGDMWGHQFMIDAQKRITGRSGLDVRLVGTLIEENTVYGQGYEVFEKSNGVSIEADYNFFLNHDGVSFYPSVGPAIRYSHERHASFVSIAYDVNGNVVNFSSEIRESEPLQIGYTLGLNFDAAITSALILGFRASTQRFNSGHQFSFIGFTIRSITWRF